MSTSIELTSPIAVLKIPRTARAFITFAKAVHDHVMGNPSFPNPQPTMDMLAADIDYAQSVADAQANPADAAAIIESAFMSVRKSSSRQKPTLHAQSAGISGIVALEAAAVASVATYFWQCGLDQKTWINAGETMKARTEIAGLTPGQSYAFRFRALTRAGAIDFSQVVSLIVQ